MPKTKNKKNYYFTQETEDAIISYIESNNTVEKNKIYTEKINYPFFKLTQNIINTYKFPYMYGSTEDKQQACICHLLENISKYNPNKGKAYSYFGTAVLRYCINENNKAYKKIVDKTDVMEVDEDYNIINDLNNNNYEIHNELFNEDNYVLNMFIKYLNLHINKIIDTNNESDLVIYLSIIDLLSNIEKLEILAKKAILFNLREATKQETPAISKILKKLKKIYDRLKEQYLQYGFISLNF